MCMFKPQYIKIIYIKSTYMQVSADEYEINKVQGGLMVELSAYGARIISSGSSARWEVEIDEENIEFVIERLQQAKERFDKDNIGRIERKEKELSYLKAKLKNKQRKNEGE